MRKKMFWLTIAILSLASKTFIKANSIEFTLTRRLEQKPHKKTTDTLEPLFDSHGATISSSYYHFWYEAFFACVLTFIRRIISIGNPPTRFRVVFDTGSPYLLNERLYAWLRQSWLTVALITVPAEGCMVIINNQITNCDFSKGKYEPDKRNSSAVSLNQRFRFNFATAGVSGNYYLDEFSLGSASKRLKLNNPILIGAARRSIGIKSGLMGLSFAFSDEPQKSVFEHFLNEGFWSLPVFSVYLTKCPNNERECNNAGKITFGKIDKYNCNKIVGMVKIDENQSHWQFQVSESYWPGITVLNSMVAITDTGTTHLVVPHIISRQVFRATGTNFSTYLIDCDAQFEVKFKINNVDYIIDSKELIDRHPAYPENCLLQIRGFQGTFMILGGPFIRSYCHIHHWLTREISFGIPRLRRLRKNTKRKRDGGSSSQIV